jgi:hypothetical protein
VRGEIFAAAFSVAKDDKQITEDEEKELKEIQKYLVLLMMKFKYLKKRTCSFATIE